MAYDLSSFQVGDEFEDSPSTLSQIISAILAEGGSFTMDGASIIITSLPNRKKTVKEEPEKPHKEEPVKEEPVKEEPVKEEPVKEEPVKEEPVKEEPVKEEPVKEEPVKEEPVKEEPKEQSSVVSKPIVAPKPKGRPRKYS